MDATTLAEYQAAIERATEDCHRASARQDLAAKVASEFKAALQKLQAVLDAGSADCDLLKQRLQLLLSSASQEVFDVLQDEQERLMATQTQLARAHGRLRRYEFSGQGKQRS